MSQKEVEKSTFFYESFLVQKKNQFIKYSGCAVVFSSELNFLRDLEEVGVTLIFDEWCCVAYILGSFVMMFQVNFFSL